MIRIVVIDQQQNLENAHTFRAPAPGYCAELYVGAWQKSRYHNECFTEWYGSCTLLISRTRCFTDNNNTIEGQCACTHRFSVLTPCSTCADMWHWTAERSCLNMTASFSLWLSSCKQSLTTCIWPNLDSTSQGSHEQSTRILCVQGPSLQPES